MRIQTFLNRVIFVIGILSFVAGMVILLYSVPKKYQLIPVGVLLAAFSVYACIYLVNSQKFSNFNFWIIYLNLKLIQRDSKCERERRNESGTRVTSRNRQPSLPGYHQHPPNYQYHHNYVKGTDEKKTLKIRSRKIKKIWTSANA